MITKLYLSVQLKNKLLVHFTQTKTQVCMAKSARVHEGVPEPLKSAGAHGTSSRCDCCSFLFIFRAFFLLKMPWNLGWIFSNLYCPQNLLSAIEIHSSHPLIHHMVSCFANLHDFSIKILKTHVLSFFEHSSSSKCLGTCDEFLQTCILFKNLLSIIGLHSSYPMCWSIWQGNMR